MDVVDNFLSVREFKDLQNHIISPNGIQFTIQPTVSDDTDDEYWCWYAQHLVFNDGMPITQTYNRLYQIFRNKLPDFRAFIRIKINFYPHTEVLREHPKHTDADYSHKAAVFSLNTCDGFTRMHDGSIIDSVENRIVFFDASKEHNSTTTTNFHGRYNINFNYL